MQINNIFSTYSHFFPHSPSGGFLEFIKSFSKKCWEGRFITCPMARYAFYNNRTEV